MKNFFFIKHFFVAINFAAILLSASILNASGSQAGADSKARFEAGKAASKPVQIDRHANDLSSMVAVLQITAHGNTSSAVSDHNVRLKPNAAQGAQPRVEEDFESWMNSFMNEHFYTPHGMSAERATGDKVTNEALGKIRFLMNQTQAASKRAESIDNVKNFQAAISADFLAWTDGGKIDPQTKADSDTVAKTVSMPEFTNKTIKFDGSDLRTILSAEYGDFIQSEDIREVYGQSRSPFQILMIIDAAVDRFKPFAGEDSAKKLVRKIEIRKAIFQKHPPLLIKLQELKLVQ